MIHCFYNFSWVATKLSFFFSGSTPESVQTPDAAAAAAAPTAAPDPSPDSQLRPIRLNPLLTPSDHATNVHSVRPTQQTQLRHQ